MSGTSIMLKRVSSESLEILSKTVTAGMIGSEADLIFRNLSKEEDTEILLLVFEKYFFRIGSYAALIIQCISRGDEQTAAVVGTGGGAGIWNVSYGANNAFAKDAKSILEKAGFEAYTV
ncbi:MAG: hypothetical protein IIZ14_09440 [Solobacterium sp.]|nr:hypothetical protein [Solobacterium sp.]